jgi:hypothetical protein
LHQVASEACVGSRNRLLRNAAVPARCDGRS